MSLEEILNKIREEALMKDDLHEKIQMILRKTMRLSKQAIFLTHKGRISEAEAFLKEASANFNKLDEMTRGHPDLFYAGSVESAFEEYAEAQIFLKLVKDKKFISPEEIGVPNKSYVLGLADAIGELRRRTLDLIRKGLIKNAEECLNLMETIYAGIISCDELLLFIPGLRRKCDVARRVIEATRGDVTTEVRRTVLNNALKELHKILESKINDS